MMFLQVAGFVELRSRVIEPIYSGYVPFLSEVSDLTKVSRFFRLHVERATYFKDSRSSIFAN